MREELNMYGTQFNVSMSCGAVDSVIDGEGQQINTIFTCGYIVGMIPSRSSSLVWRHVSSANSVSPCR